MRNFIKIALLSGLCMLSTTLLAQASDQIGDDIKVLKASVTPMRVGTDQSADYQVDVTRCDKKQIITDTESSTTYLLDCTEEVTLLVGRPLVKRVEMIAHFKRHFTCGEFDNNASYPDNCFYTETSAQNLNCSLGAVVTVSRPTAYHQANGIGFYFDHQLQTVAKEKLHAGKSARFLDGSPAILHEFAFLARCWAGSVSSSMAWQSEFKPYLHFRKWDDATENYRLNANTTEFSREAELLFN